MQNKVFDFLEISQLLFLMKRHLLINPSLSKNIAIQAGDAYTSLNTIHDNIDNKYSLKLIRNVYNEILYKKNLTIVTFFYLTTTGLS